MKKLLTLTGVAFFSLWLTGCGGGGSGGDAAQVAGAPDAGGAAPQTATLGIVITDTPAGKYDEAIATITGITLIGENGQQDVYSGSMTVDLFKLRDFVELVEVADDVEPDTIEKVRLHLSGLALIERNDEGNVEEQVDAQLAGNGKIDLKPDQPIRIRPGDVLFVTLDFDVDKSLQLTETGSGKTIVRPVVFVRVGSVPGFKDGITRVSGEIARINDVPDAFLLCTAELMAAPSGSDNNDVDERCIKVSIYENTGLFGEDGLPIRASTLAVGDLVTVVGTLALPDGEPVEPLPAGMADVDSSSGADDVDSDGDSDSGDDADSDSDSDDDSSEPLQFVLNAIVIEAGAPGTFATIGGELQAGVDADDRYPFLVAPEQGFEPDTVLTGQLYPTSRIIDPAGQDVERESLAAGDVTQVDGIVVMPDTEGENDILRTALMIIRGAVTLPEPDDEVLVGTVLEVDEGAQQITVAAGGGDRCVLADDASVVFFVEIDDKVELAEGTIADLPNGALVVNFGVEDSGGCFDADTIISRDAPKGQ